MPKAMTKKPMAGKSASKTKMAPVKQKPVAMNKSPMKKAGKVAKGARTRMADYAV